MNTATLLRQEEKERARQMVERFVRRFEESYRLLAYHAALPLVLTPELVNYLRVQFLRGDNVPWVAEVDLLLSELCKQVGYELYAMDTAVRAYLLEQMEQEESLGKRRMQEVAKSLIGYVKYLAQTNPYISPQELQAQQWAAMVYLDTHREGAVSEIAQAFQNAASQATGIGQSLVNRAELARLARITQELTPQLSAYENLVAYADIVSQMMVDPASVSSEKLEQSYQILGMELPLLTELIPGEQQRPRGRERASIPEDLQRSIVLITSSDSNNYCFGTGFVIHQEFEETYILTCAHLVRDVGGSESVIADGLPATVITSGKEDGIDLAVLKVERLWDKPPLSLRRYGEKGRPFITVDFQLFGKEHLIRLLRGTVDDQVALHPRQLGDPIPALDLRMVDDYSLQPGSSGSPIIDEESGEVLGVVSQFQGEGRSGLGISIEALRKIWPIEYSKQLYRSLMKLDYRPQVRLFRKAIESYSVAAFLIQGAPAYGQHWLLNRLVLQYVPALIRSKVVTFNLSRKLRRIDGSVLWRELSHRFGWQGKLSSPSEIAERVYQSWQRQNVLLVFHEVNCLNEVVLQELLQNFWFPLVRKKDLYRPGSEFKLLMFLVDYEGKTDSWDMPFAARVDPTWEPHTPIKLPKLTNFSDDELIDWIEAESDILPPEFTNDVERVVHEILANSENGIPELVLEEICNRCGLNWYEESEKWLKL